LDGRGIHALDASPLLLEWTHLQRFDGSILIMPEPQSYRLSLTPRQRQALTLALASVVEHYYDPTIIDRWMRPLSLEEIEGLMTHLVTPVKTDGDITDLQLSSTEMLSLALVGIWIDTSLPGMSVGDLEEIETIYDAIDEISDRYW
jgi:hypothetical protein